MSRSLLPALLTAVLLVGGCGGVDTPPSAVEPVDPSASPTSAPRPTPTVDAAPPTPVATSRGVGKSRDHGQKIAPTALPVARPDGSRGHLLAEASLPAYAGGGDESAWSITATGPESTRPVGACQKATFIDIGALHAVRRGFAAPEGTGVRAWQVVARFADAKSAWRAHQVLRTWRDDCEEWLGRAEVSPMEEVETDAGTAARYRAVYGPKKDTDASGLGIVRQGKWLSIVSLSSDGDDYPDGWTRRAVRRIAATF